MGISAGLDVHSKESVFVAQDETGRQVSWGRIPTSPEGFLALREQYGLPAGTRIGLETGTSSYYAVRHLTRLGYAPVLVHASEVRRRASRPNQKSDRRDATDLCEGIRKDEYKCIVHVPEAAILELRGMLSRRRHFVKTMTREVNAVKFLLRSEGVLVHSKSLDKPAGWDKLHLRLAFSEELQGFATFHRSLWDCAREQVKALEREMDGLAVQFQEPLGRLVMIPGVGTIVALTVIAALSDVTRFPSTKHVGSYAGLVPSSHQSGETDHHGHITKEGNGELRAMLCEAAHHASSPRHPLNPYFRTLCARRGHKMATTAVAHRLLRIMFTMLKKGTHFEVEKLGVETGAFTTETTHWYRRKAARAGSATPVSRRR